MSTIKMGESFDKDSKEEEAVDVASTASKEIEKVETVEDSQDVEVSTGKTKDEEPTKPEEEAVVAETASTASKEEVKEETKFEPSLDDIINARKDEAEKLRSEIAELRGERRKARETTKEESIFINKPDEDDLKDIDPESVAVIEMVLQKKGYVKRDDLQKSEYQDKIKTYTDQWLSKHPEYLPENDSDDKKWNQLKTVIHSNFKEPSSPKEILRNLDVVHEWLNPKILPTKSISSVKAAESKINNSSKGNSGGSTTPTKTVKNFDSQYISGFTDEEIKELFN